MGKDILVQAALLAIFAQIKEGKKKLESFNFRKL